jgi:phospholipid/cholesterol/gamma-HCH transport system substrate-binding protein
MKRVLFSAAIVLGVGAFLVLTTGASNSNSAAGTYKIELDNAFGLVSGADFKVAGVRAGTIEKIDLPPACVAGNPAACHALVTVHVTQPGFGQFRSDAFCQSRPQSLIGEYFVECQPGSAGRILKPGSTIPVTRTQSTIPGDLLQDVMRMPYRERFTLIINELGAAVAGRSQDLAAALRRAVPALTETDNLLNLLGNDSQTLQQLTVNSDAVITALANNSGQVQRFIDEANKAASDTATQQSNLQASLHKLPGFLEELRPALQKLGAATDANMPVLQNLHAASAQLNRLFVDLPAFSRSALPALRSLGQASVTGKAAVQAANPTITHLNQFARSTPELSQNLAIILHDLDDRSRAVEADPRSPGGQGYTGLEAVLQYVFNQTLAINTFGPFGHQLTVDAFVSAMCTPYATPGTIAQNLKQFGARYRSCYSWLGPNQPGVNETDPSNPNAPVPDPGGAPPGETGPRTSAARMVVASAASKRTRRHGRAKAGAGAGNPAASGAPAAPAGGGSGSGSAGSGGASGGSGGSGGGAGAPGGSGSGSGAGGTVSGIQQTVGQILGGILGGGASGSSSSQPNSTPSQPNGNQAQQLLGYLLAP